AADLVYPYAFAARWSAAERRGAGGYDPEVDRATAPGRQALLGLKVMRLDKETKDLGDLKLVLDVPQVDVWLRPGLPEGAAAVVAPPWSTLPWTVLALMDEAVTSGLGAFSEAEARRRGVPWLDLARDPRTRDALRAL